jgi:hypothetical protein
VAAAVVLRGHASCTAVGEVYAVVGLSRASCNACLLGVLINIESVRGMFGALMLVAEVHSAATVLTFWFCRS